MTALVLVVEKTFSLLRREKVAPKLGGRASLFLNFKLAYSQIALGFLKEGLEKKRKKINNIHPVLEETASRKEGEIQKACQEERERHPFIAAVGTTSASTRPT